MTEYHYFAHNGDHPGLVYQVDNEVEDGVEKITTYDYHFDTGRQNKVINPVGHYRETEYDSLGRVVKEIAWEDDTTDFKLSQTRTEYYSTGQVKKNILMAMECSPKTVPVKVRV